MHVFIFVEMAIVGGVLLFCAAALSVPVVLVWEVIDLVRIAYEPEVMP